MVVDEDALPATLNSLFTTPYSPISNRDNSHYGGNLYDPVQLTSTQALSVLELPLAKTLFGHDGDGDVNNDELSYIEIVGNRARHVLNHHHQQQQQQQQNNRSQIFHIGLAALFSFLQSNVTGPPLDFDPAETVLPPALRRDTISIRAARAKVVRHLSVDGESVYPLTPNVELFAIAKALLVDITSGNKHEDVMIRIARMRTNFLHQKLLSEVTGSLQTAIYADLDEVGKKVFLEGRRIDDEEEGLFLLERAVIHTLHGLDARARTDLERAATVRGFEFALTGKLGRRTKFQDRDISQLVVLARSGASKEDNNDGYEKKKEEEEKERPENLDLNDDTLLESISFSKDDGIGDGGIIGTVEDRSSLSPALASLDPGNQPILHPVDSAILLALASAITNTHPDNGLTREETLPYAERVLEGGSSNWQIYTQALLLRSRIEGYKSRTVERSVLQMQAVVDQVIADTATIISTAPSSASSTTTTTTFLPRVKTESSAPASKRLRFIWLIDFSTRWDLEAELASRWVKLGGLRTALEIYERLEMWAEAALCYAATDREGKARILIRRQLFRSSKVNEEQEAEEYAPDDDDRLEGPERSQLPVNAPRLFCILGDIDTDPAMYERAWEVSNGRYARAQRSLARYYLTVKPPALEKAEEAYTKSLYINRLNHGAWFAMGCVQLELEKWHDAIESFRRTVQLEETDAEAWSNLAAAILRVPTSKPSKAVQQAEDDEEEAKEEEDDDDPYRQKREALAALHRASRLKPTDFRIWDNVLTVAASIPPPTTPYADIVVAQRHLIDLLAAKKGEKAIDIPILGMLINYLVTNYEYADLFSSSEKEPQETSKSSNKAFLRAGTVPGQILSLVDESIVPLITHSASLWLLVARLERFRNRPFKALEAHEKAWRAAVALSAQGAFQMGDEKRWDDIVRATERLVRDGYVKLGPMEKEIDDDDDESDEGETERLVSKDWRFKARSAVRGILGKGKDSWEDTEGWMRLKELQAELIGGIS